jgi:hypothetical protein
LLVTREREQKPEQHLEIATPIPTHHVSAHAALMLDTARRFTEAASDLLAMRLTSMLV